MHHHRQHCAGARRQAGVCTRTTARACNHPQRVTEPSSPHTYTAQDATQAFHTFQPPVIDIDSLLSGQQAPAAALIREVQRECLVTGFLAITNHGITPGQLAQLFASARQLFDAPMQLKQALVVQDMQAGRGWEISPEHKAYMQVCASVGACVRASVCACVCQP
jgi:hypothetical protein